MFNLFCKLSSTCNYKRALNVGKFHPVLRGMNECKDNNFFSLLTKLDLWLKYHNSKIKADQVFNV